MAATAEGVAGADGAGSSMYERRINKGTPLATKKTSSAALLQDGLQSLQQQRQAQSAKQKGPA